MKIETKNNMIVLKEVYNTILLETEANKQLYVCMRDGGFEISVDGKNWTMTHKPTASNSIDAVEEITRILNEELNNATNTEDIPVTATPIIETWDYMGWEEYNDFETDYIQPQWNQTLMTKFNQLSDIQNSDSIIIIEVPSKLIPIIKSLAYYNEETHTMGIRYNLEFSSNDSNIIMVGNIPLEIKNYKL